jgi:alginate O-acetyltransferase complex protein AlgI
MLFNSIEFAIFLPIVFLLYWFVFSKNLKAQNMLLIVSSFIFYGWWDWRFLFLLIFTSLVDFGTAILIDREENVTKRKYLLGISIIANLGVLGFFKYYGFFVQNFIDAFTFLGYKPNVFTLKVILPVGLSFYTFQALSYTIDVYRKKLTSNKDIVSYFAFISFFPQLVAGPIERATHMLPQFYRRRELNYDNAADGMRQILWGLFKKIVIADSCAPFVTDIFQNYQHLSASYLVIGALFFTFQIYCDFSGYSDIAIGTARLFGFSLMRNFAFPYFSRDIAEFWRRWHISLSTWFRDYVYIPLGGSKGPKWMLLRNTFIIFVVSGFWHGANWTFIAWGFLNAIYFIPLLLRNKNRVNMDIAAPGKFFPSFKVALQILITFALTSLAWIFFRADNIGVALTYIQNIFVGLIEHPGQFFLLLKQLATNTVFYLIVILVIVEWIQRDKQHALAFNKESRLPIPKWTIYYSLTAAIVFAIYISEKPVEFIYFQF